MQLELVYTKVVKNTNLDFFFFCKSITPFHRCKYITYFSQRGWHSCVQGYPHCWLQCSCRSLHPLVWRLSKSMILLELEHWGEEAQGNVTTSQWGEGNLLWPHRLCAHPGQDPPPLYHSLTVGSLVDLWGTDTRKETNKSSLNGNNTCFFSEKI